MPSSSNLSLGPGRLLWAPVGTAEITDHTTAIPAIWKEIGFTREGSEISYSFSADPVEVAEKQEPVGHASTSRSGTVSFAMAENTVQNVTLAFNGGQVTSYGTGAAAGFKYEPPSLGTEVRRMLLWESTDKTERWLLRQVFQTGDVAVARRKGAEYATLPVSFAIESPAVDGVQPFAVFYAASRGGGVVVAP